MAAVVGCLASAPAPVAAASAVSIQTSADYAPARWVPANPNNYTVADRPSGFQINYIVIHDIEGSVDSAITMFQDPNRAGSSHYIVSRRGQMWQMVLEKDIAWHAGNWDVNTRAIGIEHEGYADTPGWYTVAEYQASAHLIASICSRWGTPLDRSHVIGHSEVPDPFHPGLFGGDSHHHDPGPYWNWTYYMNLARSYAASLPSPPHMGPEPQAISEEGGVMLQWQPAQSCTVPVDHYHVDGPNGISMDVPGAAHSAWFPGLTDGVGDSFTVTAFNADGQSSMTSNTAYPGARCSAATITATPSTPTAPGAGIALNATSTGCPNPQYKFWVQSPSGEWDVVRYYGSSHTTWNTSDLVPGTYVLRAWVRQNGSGDDYDTFSDTTVVVGTGTCYSAGLSPNVAPPQPRGTSITFIGSAAGCTSATYQFWLAPPGGAWRVVQAYNVGTSWTLNTASYPAGNFQVGVRVRQAGSGAPYESFNVSSYAINPGACVVSSLNANPGPPQVGGSITFTPVQHGCTHQYKFYLLAPSGAWKVMQAYSSKSTWTWNTSGYAAGVYQVGVWEGRSTSPSTYESFAITTFTLRAAPCISSSMAPGSASPQLVGGSITFTASSTGCASPQYEFWLQAPGGGWTVARGWASGSTWTWNTAGLATGTYGVGVWARQAGSAARYEAYFIGTFELVVTRCTAVGINDSPNSPQAAGTQVTFTASSGGCSAPRYQFLVLAPGGYWQAVQLYGSDNTFTWNTTGLAAGTYTVAVWARANGSDTDYDRYDTQTFTISG